MSYKLTQSSGVVRLADGAFIPNDLGNVDWQKYQAFIDGGGVPEPADAAPSVGNVEAFEQRQRSTALDQLDSAISKLPAAQQEAFRLVQQLLKE